MPSTGVVRLLTSQQRAVGWRRQSEVEKSLGLEKGAISRYFSTVGAVLFGRMENRCASSVEDGGRIPRPRPSTR